MGNVENSMLRPDRERKLSAREHAEIEFTKAWIGALGYRFFTEAAEEDKPEDFAEFVLLINRLGREQARIWEERNG